MTGYDQITITITTAITRIRNGGTLGEACIEQRVYFIHLKNIVCVCVCFSWEEGKRRREGERREKAVFSVCGCTEQSGAERSRAEPMQSIATVQSRAKQSRAEQSRAGYNTIHTSIIPHVLVVLPT